jgi:hypothetical protein
MLHALAARKLPLLRTISRCIAAKKPAIQAGRNEDVTAKDHLSERSCSIVQY